MVAALTFVVYFSFWCAAAAASVSGSARVGG